MDRIVLTPEGGTLRIDLKGDLEGIYEVSAVAAKQKPARDVLAGGLERLKLVAGRRNQLCLLTTAATLDVLSE